MLSPKWLKSIAFILKHAACPNACP